MTPPEIDLYSFFNSSTAYRVRIALGLMGLERRHISVNLRKGEQHAVPYRDVNPFGLVPVLTHSGRSFTQSLAIIDYLDWLRPDPLLIPLHGDPRSRVIEMSLFVACEMHPLNNMRVQQYLKTGLEVSETQRQTWIEHWWTIGFETLEKMLPKEDGWCVGTAPTLADCCVVPQVANAMRGNFDLAIFPRLIRHFEFCEEHPGFTAVAPSAQPDYVGH